MGSEYSFLLATDSAFLTRIYFRSCIPLIDKNGILFAVLGGVPSDDAAWSALIARVTVKITALRKAMKFSPKKKWQNRRGSYQSFRVGISHGGGQKVCSVGYFCT